MARFVEQVPVSLRTAVALLLSSNVQSVARLSYVNTSAIAGIHCATLQHSCLYVEGTLKLCHKHSMTQWKISAVYGFRVDLVCHEVVLENDYWFYLIIITSIG